MHFNFITFYFCVWGSVETDPCCVITFNLTGPVFVEFPIDVLYPYYMVSREVVVTKESKSFMQKIVNW